jgi:hypothetical protein
MMMMMLMLVTMNIPRRPDHTHGETHYSGRSSLQSVSPCAHPTAQYRTDTSLISLRHSTRDAGWGGAGRGGASVPHTSLCTHRVGR